MPILYKDPKDRANSSIIILLALMTTLVVFISVTYSTADAERPKVKLGSVATIPPYLDASCDTADVLTMIQQKGYMEGAPQHAAALISGRIISCKRAIDAFASAIPSVPIVARYYVPPAGLPTAFPSPTPQFSAPMACTTNPSSTDPMKLYSILGECVAFVKGFPVAGPSPSPTPVSLHVINYVNNAGCQNQPSIWRNCFPVTKIIFVLALASDAPTSAQLSLRLTNQLRPHLDNDGTARDPYTNTPAVYTALAEPTWTVAQYQQQCMNDSSTAGAVVILPPGTQTAGANFLLAIEGWTQVDLQIVVLDCEPTSVTFTNNVSYITWISNVKSSKGARWGFPLATALAVASTVAAFHPVHSTGTTTNYSIATPSPGPVGTPLKSSYNQSDMTTTNPNTALDIAATSILTPFASTTVGQVSSTDSQLAAATVGVIGNLLLEFEDPCTDPVQPDYRYLVSYPTQCFWLWPYGHKYVHKE